MEFNNQIFQIKKEKKLFKGGESDSVDYIEVLHFIFKKENAYIYFCFDGPFNSSFGNDMKWQHTQNNYCNAKIWKYVLSELDTNKTLCLNDIHDKINKTYENFWDKWENNKLNSKQLKLSKQISVDSNIIDFVKQKGTYSKNKQLIVEFITYLEESINELYDVYINNNWDYKEYILQSILYISTLNPQFFLNNIFIEDKILKSIKPSIALNNFNKLTLNQQLDKQLIKKEINKNNIIKI